MAKRKDESSRLPTLQVVMAPDLLHAFRVACLARRTTMTAVVNEFVRDFVALPPADAKPRKR